MIRPNFCSTMYFCTARLIRNAPRKCTPMTVSQSSSVILNSRLSRITPALLTSTAGGPSSAAIASTAAATCGSVADVGTGREGTSASRGDRVDSGRAVAFLEVDDGDRHPVGGEALGDAGPDPACAAGNDGHPLCVLRHLHRPF